VLDEIELVSTREKAKLVKTSREVTASWTLLALAADFSFPQARCEDSGEGRGNRLSTAACALMSALRKQVFLRPLEPRTEPSADAQRWRADLSPCVERNDQLWRFDWTELDVRSLISIGKVGTSCGQVSVGADKVQRLADLLRTEPLPSQPVRDDGCAFSTRFPELGICGAWTAYAALKQPVVHRSSSTCKLRWSLDQCNEFLSGNASPVE